MILEHLGLLPAFLVLAAVAVLLFVVTWKLMDRYVK